MCCGGVIWGELVWREEYFPQCLRGKAVEAEEAQCSSSFPAGILVCGGFGSGRRRLGALTVSAADTGFIFISVEERQAHLTSGTNTQARQPGIQVPVCVRPGPMHSLGKWHVLALQSSRDCSLPGSQRSSAGVAPVQGESGEYCKCLSYGWTLAVYFRGFLGFRLFVWFF